MTETVTTTAEGTPVQIESSEHSAQLTSVQLELISQRGRDVTTLLKILPGVAYGGESEWVRNVLAAGRCELTTRRRTIGLRSPERFSDPSRRLVPIPARWMRRPR